MAEVAANRDGAMETFRKCWMLSTDDSNMTLHGFRRFKTTHLLNLRFLEHETADMDHAVYQTGLSLGLSPSSSDRLCLKHCRRDAGAPDFSQVVTPEFILKLRELLKQYDEALAAFNRIMNMETFSLLDDEKHASLRDDLTIDEILNTRLLRADLGTRSRTDPFQRWLHKRLRVFRYWRALGKYWNTERGLGPTAGRPRKWSYQNTILVADIIGRLITTTLTTAFLIAPLAILSYASSKEMQLVITLSCILVLCFFVSLFLKVSSFEIMAISAAYAAVLRYLFPTLRRALE
ncbi:hypothetical protein B0H63DRAFT_84846 [Podospora didyma]|uniref:DUF6594 domain-containing protein n=1 Tax=Podospora didyma TaxID=330526 RepID=A0AAE0K165_9PEZI|nr:hypothetical protein B0H63DRAFT_84846 [Podospora didyma]